MNHQAVGFQAFHSNMMRQIELSQRVLTLVSMGREQAFLKQNPERALFFVSAANQIYNASGSVVPDAVGNTEESTPDNPSLAKTGVLDEVYPAIWNLEMECLLQTRQFDKLRELTKKVIGSTTNSCVVDVEYCALRQAFYYRALAGMDLMANYFDGLHPEKGANKSTTKEFDDLVTQIEADLVSSVGTKADRSIGTI